MVCTNTTYKYYIQILHTIYYVQLQITYKESKLHVQALLCGLELFHRCIYCNMHFLSEQSFNSILRNILRMQIFSNRVTQKKSHTPRYISEIAITAFLSV